MQDFRTGKTVYRYGAKTDKGHKITWAESETHAVAKLEARGLTVKSIRLETQEETIKRIGFPTL